MAGQVWATNLLGGFAYSDNLSKYLRFALQSMMKYRQFCDAKDATAHKGAGEIFHWNVYSDVQNQGGQILESNLMPETNFEITQGSLLITEYGNSIPYTGKLDDLSEHPIKEIINKVIRKDAKKAFDINAYAQFNASPLVVVPAGGTSLTDVALATNGTPGAANDAPLTKSHVISIVDLMKERDIEPYMNDDYYCIGHPTTFSPLQEELEEVNKYVESGVGQIRNGEIGRYKNTRFIEQTNIAKENWASGKSNQAHFFGADTVAEGIAIPEHIRGKIPEDYGRSKGVAWYGLMGFGLVHADPEQARIIKWGSTG